MSYKSNNKSSLRVARRRRGAFTLPLLCALAACGSRYELGEFGPSGSNGSPQIGDDLSGPETLGHVIIDEREDLDAEVSKSFQGRVGDVDGDGYDDWVTDVNNGATTVRGESYLQLVYGGPRVEGDIYRADRLGPIVTFEDQT